jgi:hypothetical protein
MRFVEEWLLAWGVAFLTTRTSNVAARRRQSQDTALNQRCNENHDRQHVTFGQPKRCNGIVIDCCVDVRGGFLGDGSSGIPPAPPKGPLGPGGALRFPGAGAAGRI